MIRAFNYNGTPFRYIFKVFKNVRLVEFVSGSNNKKRAWMDLLYT